MPKPNSDCRATERKHPWPMVRLGDVCEINLGKTPPRGNARFWDKGRRDGYKWLSIADLANTQGGSVFDSKEYISKAAVEEVGVPVVLAGTFLLSFKLTLGRTAIAGCDLYTNEAIAAMPVKPAFQGLVDLQFLNLYCRFFDWEDFAAKDEKVLGKTLNKKKLAEVPLPLPPLSVQREIVARLERELAAVEKIKKDFEALAETAKAEFKAELKEVFEEISRGGAETRRLGDVCERLSSGKNITAKRVFKIGVIPVYGANGLRGYTEKPNFEGECCVIGRQGALCGNVKYFKGKAYMSDHAVVAVFKPYCNARFMLHQLGIMNLGQLSTQAAQPGLSVKVLSEQEVLVPPLAAQREVVERLDSAKARAEKLEAKAREGVAVCETMRKAILKEAFE